VRPAQLAAPLSSAPSWRRRRADGRKPGGWVGPRSTTTVFRSAPLLPDSVAVPAAVGPDAKLLAGNGFDPRRIYAARAPGVVTIFSEFGSDPASATLAQGSGFVVSRRATF
jgi:hypothetical protein